MEDKYWKGKKFAFNQNRECEFFPCHETDDPDDFNCLFCYCPLYALGDRCGGKFSITQDGIKDCSACGLPHKRDNYGYVNSRFSEICEIVRSQLKDHPRS